MRIHCTKELLLVNGMGQIGGTQEQKTNPRIFFTSSLNLNVKAPRRIRS
jgi:hypothetical protein